MNETLTWLPAWLAGLLLGGFFFGGLWWTVKKGLASPNPALWFLGSALLRTGVALAGFYFVSGGDWKRLLSCLLGFIIARVAITWFTRANGKEAGDAHQS